MSENRSLRFMSPFTAAYWQSAAAEVRAIRMLTITALFIALRVVLESVSVPIGENLYIVFGYLVNALGSAVYGPFLALLSGLCTDLISFAVHPLGVFFPGYTLSAMLGSLFYAVFLYRRRISILRVFLAKLTVNIGVNVCLGALWSSILYGKGYYYYLVKSLLKNLIMLPFETLLLCLLFRALLPFCVREQLLPSQDKIRVT